MAYLRLLGFLIVVFMLVAGGSVVLDRYVPDRLNPLETVTIDEEPGPFTQMKLTRLKVDAGLCGDVLAASSLEYEPLPDREMAEGCRFNNVVLLQQSTISWGGDVTLKCPALVALSIWEQHDLKRHAREILGKEVIRIRHYGTYACRNVYGRATGRRSEHASANAIDVAGFVLEDGSEISVLDDWGADNEKGVFLEAIHDSACERFSVVLGPDYNAAHANHFHFDMGAWTTCR